MPSLSSKDRVSLCRFTFDDGRRCRTPRISTSPDFCHYHAKREAQFRANEKLADDLSNFFSGDYLTANDLNTALTRVFVAVARGEIKPRAARTLAYLAQTMLQTLHLAQNEFISACGHSDWRKTIVNSLDANYAYRFPSPSQPAPPQAQTPPQPATPPPPCQPERSEGPRRDPAPPPTAETRRSTTATPPTPTPNPHAAPGPPHPAPQANSSPVVAGLARPEPSSTPDASQPKPSAPAATPSAPPSRPAPQTHDPYAVRLGPEYRLIVDGKPF
jgi:hypothetical protein